MSSQPPVVRIGARGSQLSLAQAGQMQRRIAAALGAAPEDAEKVAPLIVIRTSGDQIQDRRLLEVGGKALFTKEIEEAMLDGRIDCAVHSMKDMPAVLPPGLVIAAIPEREDPRDAFLSREARTLEDLPKGAKLGTASLRRQAQSLHARPDLDVQLLRGNVGTRMAKLEAGEYDAIILALSGLKRLGLDGAAKSFIDPVERPPAPGQGALAIETREADQGQPWLAALRDMDTTTTVAAERGAMAALESSCRTPIGAYATLKAGQLFLIVEALSPDGRLRFRREEGLDLTGAADAVVAARELGLKLGAELRDEAGDAIILPE
ncbi:MAG: hydroxymethylbilane synthase [Phenylobacterium sp.]|uniref:hydroxymethylbilane synthase n=1 Tax=Phenylobacterium sp. TaxID=1871053 RepID=UPI00273347DB|nr:hydroxymethylbilane synthase [Phenylobacterium sp.]MDP3117978.1 hydroxymethylbilane synthase [Phenylobacterium sp.]